MSKNRIIALISSMVLASSIMYTLQINAEVSNNGFEYSSDDTSEDTTTSLEENESADTSENITTDDLVLRNYQQYSSEFLKKIVIVGDSIASGFKTYDRLPTEQVLATGSVGARNIHSFQFDVDGESLDILDALSIRQPQYIFMSMGMNDINLSTSDEYIVNYTQNINDILQTCANSTIIVMGITPVLSYSDFCTNDKIDTYNDALKQMAISMQGEGKKVYYINVSKYLKDEQNSLKNEFSSGDGVHLAGSAYDYIFTSMILSLDWIK